MDTEYGTKADTSAKNRAVEAQRTFCEGLSGVDPQIADIISHFEIDEEVFAAAPYGSGHINDTYCLCCRTAEGREKRYILQRMNSHVFLHPLEVMENIVGVTTHLRHKILAAGGDASRETMHVVLTRDKQSCYLDAVSGYWRAYDFVEHATSFDQVQDQHDFYESGVAFGHFQCLLADYPAETLHETIPDFHNTADRYRKFEEALQADVCGRAHLVEPEIAFIRERKAVTAAFGAMRDRGELPLRVTHNDTKLNNILIDDVSHKGVCVIDLDTVMPGFSAHDFGDAIRFGASTAAEDEQDLSLVSCDLELFGIYTRGYIEGCAGSLTEKELAVLPLGAIVMTFECGIRFLTDFLSGDVYFKTSRAQQNLDRARTQFRLVEDMERKQEQMGRMIDEIKAGANGKDDR